MKYFDDLEFVCHGEFGQICDKQYQRKFADYWGIQFSRRGKFRLQINDDLPESTDGCTVFITYPGATFSYGSAADNKIENKIFICFRGERVKRYLAGGLLVEREHDALLNIADPDGFMTRLRNLRTLLMLPESEENHARAVWALENLLLEMHSNIRCDRNPSDWRYPAFAALADRIGAQPELNWDFNREARKLSVCYAHFRRLFEQFMGTPPGKFLLIARMNKAAELLTSNDLPIREIARECGFEDEFYFSRIFKKYRNMAPKFYRAVFRNN